MPLEIKARDSMGISHKQKEQDQTKRGMIKARMQQLGSDLDTISITYNETFDLLDQKQGESAAKKEETELAKKVQSAEEQVAGLKKSLEQKSI